MKSVVMAALVTVGLTAGSMAFGDDLKDDGAAKVNAPENLSSQVIDRGSSDNNGDGAAAAKPSEDDTREVPHFAGHAFSE